MRQQEGLSSDKVKSHTPRWVIHKQENNYSFRDSPKGLRGLNPTLGSTAQRSSTGKTSPSGEFGFEGHRLTPGSSRGLMEIRDLTCKGLTQSLPSVEAVIWQQPGLDLPSPGEVGNNSNSRWGHRLLNHFGELLLQRANTILEFFLQLITTEKSYYSPIVCRHRYWDASGQAVNWTPTQPHVPADRLSQDPWVRSHFWTWPCPPEDPGPSPTHQYTGNRSKNPRALQPETQAQFPSISEPALVSDPTLPTSRQTLDEKTNTTTVCGPGLPWN